MTIIGLLENNHDIGYEEEVSLPFGAFLKVP